MRREWCIAPRVFTPADVSVRAAELERVFKQAGVTVAILFGSLAAPTSEAGDLDLAVEGVGDRFDDQQFLYETLCRLFRADNIDLVPLSRAPFMLRRRALSGGRVLYEATPGRIRQMIEDVLFAQEDFRYLAGMVDQQLRARLRGA